MMNNKVMAVLAVAIVVAAGACLYVITDREDNNKEHLSTAGQIVTDAMNRKVTVPDSLENGIVTIGCFGPLRFLSMFGVVDMIIETDKGDVTDSKNGRGYSYAYPINDRTAAQYHDDNKLEAATVESIAKKNPGLIVVDNNIYNNYKENCDTLAKKCTLIVMWAQEMTNMSDENGKLANFFVNNVDMLGKVLGMEKRSSEIIKDVEAIIADIGKLKGTSNDKVYIAGVTIRGSNTLNTTFTTYLPNNLNGVKNAYIGSETSTKVVLNMDGTQFVDNTSINKIVIDPSSSDKIATQDSQAFLKYIYGINNDGDSNNDIPLYVTVPIVWDSINYDCALASAYYVESVVYKTLTAAEAKDKIVKVFETFYGEAGSKVFDDMSTFFKQKSAANNVELPLLSEVKIVRNGNAYGIVAA